MSWGLSGGALCGPHCRSDWRRDALSGPDFWFRDLCGLACGFSERFDVSHCWDAVLWAGRQGVVR